ncbi:hypothetical protein EN794_039480 [Mesorhizobium sp. M00.F.Ca.ET.151.01.1.1]|nr:hypothetical protein EN842_33890 [bacterium M00.F.Ca.ET.199.01.1.1]TGT03003.1 hypothetical protein EN820_22300 [bacterium M00.F.Ca.ET.177.01.1.1]TGT57939.1 hypothetical protein EN813_035370 [Mesorhizobium sp. M00.F.Ca.ET.170.01.1.1]TGU06852.1 hypothetical protein EN806_33160 [bacterium M00.F.Ca.ET.163.01.1.1]TGU91553.1 hypothetical protein EN794_039480 [Mesorhizobium sp. M00.F.Ca.ET.151.01.1.1]TGV53241.1 hypothetical protein EN784_41005 [bacterium M00.F.Ca.ET.141.01.1.1]
MQQMTGQAMTTLAKSLDSSTGPGAEAITGVHNCVNARADGETDASATVTLHITHNRVIATAMLNMGPAKIAQCVFERRRGSRKGWELVRGTDFKDETSWISPELADLANRIPLPYEVANMLPGKRATAAAVAQAAQEVANG